MTKTDPTHNLEQLIKTGDISMRPRLYFVLERGLMSIGIVLAVILSIYLGSSIYFIVHENGLWLLTSFGWQGIGTLILSLPWLIIGLLILLVTGIEFMGWHFQVAYRRPVVYSAAGIILIIVGVSVFAAKIHVHEYILEKRLPIFRPLYDRVATYRPRDAYFVTILMVSSTADWSGQIVSGAPVMIHVSPSTAFPTGNDIDPGSNVIVFGPLNGNTILARGIEELSDDNTPPFIIEELQETIRMK